MNKSYEQGYRDGRLAGFHEAFEKLLWEDKSDFAEEVRSLTKELEAIRQADPGDETPC